MAENYEPNSISAVISRLEERLNNRLDSQDKLLTEIKQGMANTFPPFAQKLAALEQEQTAIKTKVKIFGATIPLVVTGLIEGTIAFFKHK